VVEPWHPPSPGAAALLRQAADWFLEGPAELVGQLDEAIAAAFPAALRSDLTLTAEAAASTRANLVHWATCTRDAPGSRVPANVGAEVLTVARDATRRGADQMLLSTYHAGQNVAWRYCMQLMFSLSSDPDTLAEALDIAARSIFQYVDDTVTALQAQIERERAELTRGTHAERLEVVNLILEGAPITSQRASSRLGYDLSRRHTAAILWSDPATADQAELDRAAEALARAAGATRQLTVIASGSSVWVWFLAAADVDPDGARAALEQSPRVRAAVGFPGAGIDGFRRSHFDALSTQRLMNQRGGELRFARFADVQLVALAAHDPERAGAFVARTLGELATASPELRETLRTYIREQFSASRAARALFAHRNTVLNRLQRAQQLLPAPLDRNGLEVGLALDIVHWLGAAHQAPQLTTPAGRAHRSARPM
jgi:DNA-binding PucR family transcriptional regulator